MKLKAFMVTIAVGTVCLAGSGARAQSLDDDVDVVGLARQRFVESTRELRWRGGRRHSIIAPSGLLEVVRGNRDEFRRDVSRRVGFDRGENRRRRESRIPCHVSRVPSAKSRTFLVRVRSIAR